MDVKIIHLIPAEPGTRLAWTSLLEGEFSVSFSKVIAWAHVDHEDYAPLEPVTTEGIRDGSKQILPIFHPDGTVDDPFNATFDTVDQWREQAERELRAIHASKGEK